MSPDTFEVIEARANHLDGAPEDYQQVYADDVGPFVFPLASAWVTKHLTAPATIERQITRLLVKGLWFLVLLLIFGYTWGLLAFMLPIMAIGYLAMVKSIWRLVLLDQQSVNFISSLLPVWARPLLLRGLAVPGS